MEFTKPHELRRPKLKAASTAAETKKNRRQTFDIQFSPDIADGNWSWELTKKGLRLRSGK